MVKVTGYLRNHGHVFWLIDTPQGRVERRFTDIKNLIKALGKEVPQDALRLAPSLPRGGVRGVLVNHSSQCLAGRRNRLQNTFECLSAIDAVTASAAWRAFFTLPAVAEPCKGAPVSPRFDVPGTFFQAGAALYKQTKTAGLRAMPQRVQRRPLQRTCTGDEVTVEGLVATAFRQVAQGRKREKMGSTRAAYDAYMSASSTLMRGLKACRPGAQGEAQRELITSQLLDLLQDGERMRYKLQHAWSAAAGPAAEPVVKTRGGKAPSSSAKRLRAA